jgi:hypothetical protein
MTQRRRRPPTHPTHLGHLVRQLECGALESKVSARADLQDEAKVDVHDVPCVVEHDVAIVAVLGLGAAACDLCDARDLCERAACGGARLRACTCAVWLVMHMHASTAPP